MIPLILALAVAGGFLGALGARCNRVRTGDELVLWIMAGAVGGPLSTAEYAGILWAKNLLPGIQLPVLAVATGVTAGAGLLGAVLTPLLDESEDPARWAASLLLKWIRSPLATTAGMLAAATARLLGRPVDFRRGMLFVDVGPGAGALALGGVAWCRARCFGKGRCTTDALARHEAVHSRTVAAVGELGFYLTYLTAGIVWAKAQGGPWNSLTVDGCGQPFEKTAHTYTSDPPVARRCGKRRRGPATSGGSAKASTTVPAPPER